jgi:hypothetical protein
MRGLCLIPAGLMAALVVTAPAVAQLAPLYVPPSVNPTPGSAIYVPPRSALVRPVVVQVPPAAAPWQPSAIRTPPSQVPPPLYIDQLPPAVQASGNIYARPSLDSPATQFVKFFRDGEWYFSFGTSRQYWAPTDIHVSQPSQGNDFVIHDVQAHDEPDLSSFATGDIFNPQYNIRIGRFINDKRTVAVEFSMDHTKYTVTDGQIAQVTGTIAGAPVNSSQVLNASYFRYILHNGANFLMSNLVYRQPVFGQTNESFSLALLGKAGVGIVVPHVENTILGHDNDVGQKIPSNYFGIHNGWWQFGGLTTGIEGGFRFVVWKPVYIELTDKVAYARLWDLPAYQGLIDHSLLMNEVVFSVGFTYDGASTQK